MFTHFLLLVMKLGQ